MIVQEAVEESTTGLYTNILLNRAAEAAVRAAWWERMTLICYSRCNCACNAGRREYFSFVFFR